MIFAVSVIFVLFGTSSAFAETYTINIPTGAADPNAPYFWQSEKDGKATGEITIKPGDTIEWSNADTAFHTVTSGVSPDLGGDGADGQFDSEFFSVGESWSHKFTESGTFPYFCSIHPWMTGIVIVESGFSVIRNVGDDAGDGSTTFDVEYDFNRVIADATVDVEQKAITFTLVGKTKNNDNTLTLYLSKNLISNPNVVWVDGKTVSDFKVVSEGGINVVTIPVTETTEQVTILGSSVVPEFGALTAIVLATSMVAIIFATSRSKIIPKLS
ncbi:MAG: plastocyanin/azurin family copper-binding protein [Nitrosopumilaceae archaeon]